MARTGDTFTPLSDGVITLREFVDDDATWLAEASADPEIPRFTMVPIGITAAEYLDWIQRGREITDPGRGRRLLIADAKTGAPLGSAGIGEVRPEVQTAEVFYWVAAPARRRGVATRTVRLLAQWSFTVLGLARLELFTQVDNVASQAVATSAGFVREGILRSLRPVHGVRTDLVLFSQLPTDTPATATRTR